jgi:hypothetical protein
LVTAGFGSRVIVTAGLFADLGVALATGIGLAELTGLATGGRLLIPPGWIAMPLFLGFCVFKGPFARLALRFVKLAVFDSAEFPAVASRIVLGLLMLILVLLAWFAWEFSF